VKASSVSPIYTQPMVTVEVYTRESCGLCDDAIEVIRGVQRDEPFALRLICVDEIEDLQVRERYASQIPVVVVDGHRAFKYRLDSDSFRARVRRAQAVRTRRSNGHTPPISNKMDNSTIHPLISSPAKAIFLALSLGAGVSVGALEATQGLATRQVALPASLAGEALEQPAGALRLTALDGSTVDIASLRGSVVFVNFWASWCPPCVEELPSIVALKQRLAGHRFEILAVSEDDTEEEVRNFFSKGFPPFPVMLDQGQRVTREWGTFKYPETYVVNADGRVVSKFVGGRDWDSPDAVEYFRNLAPKR